MGIWRQDSGGNTPRNGHPKPGTEADLATGSTGPTTAHSHPPPTPVRSRASSQGAGGTAWGISRCGSPELAGQADAAGGFDGGGLLVGGNERPRAPASVAAAAGDYGLLDGEAGGGGMRGEVGGRRERARVGIMEGRNGAATAALAEENKGTCGGAVAGGNPSAFGSSHYSDDRHHQQRQQQQYQPVFARVVVTCEMLRAVLGPEVYESEVAARIAVPGTCTGLAWTPTGGELLFIECTSMPGSGGVKLTGKLGEASFDREAACNFLKNSRSINVGRTEGRTGLRGRTLVLYLLFFLFSFFLYSVLFYFSFGGCLCS